MSRSRISRQREYQAVLSRRLLGCQSALRELGISVEETRSILSAPEGHWRRKVEVQSNGKVRICYSPSRRLRKLQRSILRFLREHFVLALPITGFEPSFDIVRNGHWHRRNRSSLWLDLVNAFETVETYHIARFLEREGILPDLAWVMSWLCTLRGRLRQGSPVSPTLFNLLMTEVDLKLLTIVPLDVGAMYTRYGDDLCFSSPTNEFPPEFRQVIMEILSRHHLRVNQRKIRSGRKGVLEFPGVVIIRGRIRPRTDYLIGVMREVEEGRVSPIQLTGHRGFLHQFGGQGRSHLIEQALARTPPLFS